MCYALLEEVIGCMMMIFTFATTHRRTTDQRQDGTMGEKNENKIKKPDDGAAVVRFSYACTVYVVEWRTKIIIRHCYDDSMNARTHSHTHKRTHTTHTYTHTYTRYTDGNTGEEQRREQLFLGGATAAAAAQTVLRDYTTMVGLSVPRWTRYNDNWRGEVYDGRAAWIRSLVGKYRGVLRQSFHFSSVGSPP